MAGPAGGETVVVALSGGVDSSAAALLLKEGGFSVVGMTLKTWPKELCDTVPPHQTCCSGRDIEDARAVADALGIPFYVVEASRPFQEEVMDYFVDGYARGLTPNPCVICNRRIKCGILLGKAKELGARWVATGHYARSGFDGARRRYLLRQAADGGKDQSYVLCRLTQEHLAHLLLPLGERTKAEVRELARRAGLRVADKPESMELCFLPEGDTQGFLRRKVPSAFVPGAILDRQSRVLGRHQGIAAYTVGQRKRLGIAHDRPLYVLEVDPVANRVIVGGEEELEAASCRVRDLNWVAIPDLKEPMECSVKVRYRSDKIPARIIPDGPSVRVEFKEPVAGGVSRGQAAVFYEGDVLLGGGWIERRWDGETGS